MVKSHLKKILFRCCFVCLVGCIILLGPASRAWTLSWEPREVVRNYLMTHYPWAEIEILDISVRDTLPQDPPKKIHLISCPLGRAIFSFGFKSGDKAIVHAQIRALDWVVTSRRPLRNHQIIQKEDVYLALMDVKRMPKDSLTHLEAVWGKTVTRSLGANMPIMGSALGDIPVIKKGQRVTLIASSLGLKITTLGEAREDGFQGQQLKVINLSSKRDIRGVPLDETHVQVEF
jgi:flagella basal body P-ring formation protein FlgA